jgi:hypothetical protein
MGRLAGSLPEQSRGTSRSRGSNGVLPLGANLFAHHCR